MDTNHPSCKSFSLIQSKQIGREQNGWECYHWDFVSELDRERSFWDLEDFIIRLNSKWSLKWRKQAFARPRHVGPLWLVRCLYAFAKDFLDCKYWHIFCELELHCWFKCLFVCPDSYVHCSVASIALYQFRATVVALWGGDEWKSQKAAAVSGHLVAHRSK